MADAGNVISNNNWTSQVSPEAMAAKKNNTIDMQGFLKIMAAQMKNQSFSSGSGSGSDNSQYVTEMALFTAIQAMNTQTSQSNKQYAASLVGSNVLINTADKSTGKPKQISGPVVKAIFNSTTGDSYIQVGDDTYDLSSVAQVLGSGNTQTAATYLLTARQYAISLVGKNVVFETKDTDGKEQNVTGTVQSVAFDPTTDEATLTMKDGKTCSAGEVIQVLADSKPS